VQRHISTGFDEQGAAFEDLCDLICWKERVPPLRADWD
jgi:hypothetical protein